jgi:hypothetical protein
MNTMKTPWLCRTICATLLAFGQVQSTPAQTLTGKFVYSFDGDLYLRSVEGVPIADLPLEPAGSPQHLRLTATPEGEAQPRLSPDGTRVISDGRIIDLTTAQFPITSYPAPGVLDIEGGTGWPTWDVTGQWIAYAPWGEGVFAVRADGAAPPVKLTKMRGGYPVWPPTMTEDAITGVRRTQIAFAMIQWKPYGIWLMDVTISPTGTISAGPPRQLSPVINHNLDWQPSGLLAYNRQVNRKVGSEVFALDPVTLTEIRLTSLFPGTDQQPRWSPDLNFIAFFRYDPITTEPDGGAFVIDLNQPALPAYLVIPGAFHFTWGP